LARQHFKTFRERFSGLPVRIAQASRLVTSAELKATKEGLASGQVDIVVGTHALLSKSIEFKDLGLLIVDEEQHFGVGHKERLKSLRDSVDQLKQELGDCVILLAGAADGRVSLIAGVHGTKALSRVKAGNVVAHVAAQIDGKGGGRPDMAQGGGSDLPGLPAILATLPAWIAAQ